MESKSSAEFLEEHKDFLYDKRTSVHIIYEGDIRFVKKRFGYEIEKLFSYLIPEINLSEKTSKIISRKVRKLKKNQQFVYNPNFDPQIMEGMGITAGNMNRQEWQPETLDFMLAQPDIKGLIFDGADKTIIRRKNAGEVTLCKT